MFVHRYSTIGVLFRLVWSPVPLVNRPVLRVSSRVLAGFPSVAQCQQLAMRREAGGSQRIVPFLGSLGLF